MNFIKNAIDGKLDELVHKQFRRFGKGVFTKKAMVQVKKSKDGFQIKTTFEYLDGILLYFAEHSKGDAEVSGTIQGASDLEAKAKKFGLTGEKKNIMGVKKLKLNAGKINVSRLKDMLNEFKDEFLLLSVKGHDFELISKEGLPKPGKADKEDAKDKIDFCKLIVKDGGLAKELLFDVDKDFKLAIARHVFEINDFEIPKQYENDDALARMHGLRKGVIKRELEIDGIKSSRDYEFKA